jgi:hypothetical protein
MLSLLPNVLKEYLEWVGTVAFAVFALRHAGKLIALLLDMLYQMFIQQS